jgi:hypothetical protein
VTFFFPTQASPPLKARHSETAGVKMTQLFQWSTLAHPRETVRAHLLKIEEQTLIQQEQVDLSTKSQVALQRNVSEELR